MSIILPVISEFDDKGIKAGIKSLKQLAASQLGASFSAAGFVQIMQSSVSAALQDEKSQRLLAVALRNTAGANDYAVSKAEDFISSLQTQFGIADDELRPALAKLATVTNDTAEAQTLLQSALNISAFTGKDLAQVSSVLQRAYQGNFQGLRKLGVAVSDGAIKNKDFAQAMEEINLQTQGAAQTLADSAEGSFKKLSTNIDELKETLGREAIPRLEAYAKAGNNAIKWVKESQDKGWFKGLLGDLVGVGDNAKYANNELTALESRNRTSAALASKYAREKAAQDEADRVAKEKSAAAAEKAAAATKKLADANKTKLADALQTAKDKLEELTSASNQHADSIRDTVTSYVNLSEAVSNAQSREDTYNAALADRKAAYEALAKLQTSVFDAATGETTVADAEDLADAMERVAQAESAVAAAQGQRKSYTALFQEQITAAKSFGESLKQLVANGLLPAGLQQLLNLGPVAGAQVAKDILSGVGGLSVSSINQSLAGVSDVGAQLGTASAGQQFGSAILGAQGAVSAVQQAQTMNVTIQATSADPDKIVAAIVAWAKKNGKLPSVIKVS